MFVRWMKFNAVGAAGIVVQLAALWLLKGVLGVNYLAATALAVEIAVLHNFVWHERWTWRDRAGDGVLWRLLRFNATNGLVSIAVNVGLMRLLVGRFQIPYLAANLLAIAAGSIANFLLSDWIVFRRESVLVSSALRPPPRAATVTERSPNRNESGKHPPLDKWSSVC